MPTRLRSVLLELLPVALRGDAGHLALLPFALLGVALRLGAIVGLARFLQVVERAEVLVVAAVNHGIVASDVL